MGFRSVFMHAAVCAACLSPATGFTAEPWSVTLAHGSKAEQRTREQLLAIVAKHDLAKWTRTRKIIIDQEEIPHSHPVLTLHAKHVDRPDLLLSTFVHEQLHWVVNERQTRFDAAIRELRALYPTLPIGFPQGAEDAESNYAHLIIIYLEYMADRELLGKAAADKIMAYWRTSHYTALVATVLHDEARIAAVVHKHGLTP